MIKNLIAPLLFTLFLFAPKIAFADTTSTALLAPVADSFTDYAVPYAVQPNGALQFSLNYLEENTTGGTNYCYLNTQTIYLKFDLSGVTEPIRSAELNMHLSSPVTAATVPMQLYGALDGWEESNLRWQSRILTEAQPFGGAVGQVDGDRVRWSSTAGELAEWLESERLGDGVATLTFKSSGMTGCVPVPINPSEDMAFTFADRTDGDMMPTLEVSNNIERLSVPTSVTMSGIDSAESSTDFRAIIFVTISLLIITTGTAIFFQILFNVNQVYKNIEDAPKGRD